MIPETMMRTCSANKEMGQGPCTLTLWQVRAVCTQREPTGRVIIDIVTEREEKREREEKTNEENDGREKERRDEVNAWIYAQSTTDHDPTLDKNLSVISVTSVIYMRIYFL